MSQRFELVKRGYDPETVDKYVQSLEVQIAQYRAKDKAINNAIVSAQEHADTIILNSKKQGRLIRENTAKQLQDIFESINEQRRFLADFSNDYEKMVATYLKALDNEDFRSLNAKIDRLEAYLGNFVDEVSEDLEIERRMPDDVSDADLPTHSV